MQAAARNGKYDIVRQAGMDLVKIHHDLENEKQPRPIVQKPPPPLNYQQSPPPPLNPFQLVQKSASQLNSPQFPPNPLSSPFQLAQKCAPTPPQVQNPALKCARPFSGGFKMRAACAPRCANFPKNPIFSPKTQKTAIFDNTPRQPPQLPASEGRPPAIVLLKRHTPVCLSGIYLTVVILMARNENWARKDSNLGPRDYESPALPLSYGPACLYCELDESGMV